MFMGKTFFPSSYDGYAEKPFVWEQAEFGTFCCLSYKVMWEHVFSKHYVTDQHEFEDAMQNAVVKLMEQVKRGWVFESNEKAGKWLRSEYYHCLIDEYRRKIRSARLLSENRERINGYAVHSNSDPGRSMNRLIEIAFGEMDKSIEEGECELTDQEYEFYQFYKALSLSAVAHADFTEIITAKMRITKVSYRKLKSKLKKQFRHLLANANIFILK